LKKIVFYGDGLLCNPDGYGEQIADLLTLRHPETAFQSFHYGETELTLQAARKDAALHVLGKAPDWVYLGLGHPDLLLSTSEATMLGHLDDLLKLILQKTRAHIVLASVCEAFLFEEAQKEAARSYNAKLSSLMDERVLFLDLNSRVNEFLIHHRRGSGEKRALHSSPLKLTSMGRVFLSHAALESLPWSNL
jgi:lysophospholipase L1-like esterase